MHFFKNRSLKPPTVNTALIIDSTEATRIALSQLLTTEWPHLSVMTAETGIKGLKLACDLQPDLILLESDLEGLDSFQIAKVLRHLAETQNIPLIALTGQDAIEDQRIAGLTTTCHATVEKPISPEKLRQVIATVNGEVTATTLSSI